MEIYLLKSAACLVIFYAFYKLCMERENMHQIKRFYLLGTVLASFSIPLVTFTQYIEIPTTLTVLSEGFVTETPVSVEVPQSYWPMILLSVYTLGVLFFSLKFGRNLYFMIQKIRKNPLFKNGNIFHVLLNTPTTPHTFFSYVFLNKRKFEAQEIPEEVLLHEQAHAREFHSVDVILMELLQIVFWFNPFLYLIKHSIKLNHEFLADRAVLNKGVETANYQTILLAFSSNANAPELANSINYSFIKKRFTVMKTSTSKRTIWLRSLFLLPLLATLIYGFSTTKIVEKTNDTNTQTSNKAIPTARSIEIQIEEDGTYEVDGMHATKNNLAKVVGRLHQDLTPAIRNHMMNIHITHPKEPSRKEVQFIFDSLKEYGFYRLVAGNQEVVRGKGNTPMKSESVATLKNKVSWEKKYAKEFNEGAKRNGKLSIVVTVNVSQIMVNGKTVALKEFASEVDRVTKNWSTTDFNDAHPSVLIAATPTSFLKKLDAEFRKTNYFKENGRQSIIPTSPPPPPPSPKDAPPVQVIMGVNDGDPNVPPPPPPPPAPEDPLDHVIKMAKKGAIFYYEGKKVTSDKAIELIKKNRDLNIHSTGYDSKKPVVKITKEPIYLRKKNKTGAVNSNYDALNANKELNNILSKDPQFYLNNKKISPKNGLAIIQNEKSARFQIINEKDQSPLVLISNNLEITNKESLPTVTSKNIVSQVKTMNKRNAKFYKDNNEIDFNYALSYVRKNKNASMTTSMYPPTVIIKTK